MPSFSERLRDVASRLEFSQSDTGEELSHQLDQIANDFARQVELRTAAKTIATCRACGSVEVTVTRNAEGCGCTARCLSCDHFWDVGQATALEILQESERRENRSGAIRRESLRS